MNAIIKMGCVFFTAFLVAGMAAAYTAEEGSDAEGKGVVGKWVTLPDEDLPNVLILGDSISIGYTLQVRKLLKGQANVFRPHSPDGTRPVNCQGTQWGVKHIDDWLAGRTWDVIHFNFGLHDLKHVDAETGKNSAKAEDPRQADIATYSKNLDAILEELQATGARLIFATTTPVPPGVDNPLREPEAPPRYNAAALKIMDARGIPVNDLYALCQDRLDELQRPANVHFSSKGSGVLGEQVAGAIGSALEQRRKAVSWTIDTTEEWERHAHAIDGLEIGSGAVRLQKDHGTYRSELRRFPEPVSAVGMVVRQSPEWSNWSPVHSIGPENLEDAPVAIALGEGNYWLFGRYGRAKERAQFNAEDATLEGFDVPLKTTPFKNQYDAPGGLKPGLGGYHAWQSRDLVHWVHHGPVSEHFSRWVTSAEFVDGELYLYYDFPNDQDPHLYIDDDLLDGVPGENTGLAFKDPSDGSDSAILRDLDGSFHLIYEDWSPINASKHSWDSPLAGHAASPHGVGDFRIRHPVVDERTEPTGTLLEYQHPHWLKEDPKNFPSNTAVYELHEPEQDAYGDWAAIRVGDQYYLFADYHPAGKAKSDMRVAWFTSSSIDGPFRLCGSIGNGHPDPDIFFADGKFWIITQTDSDFVSPGPWVDRVAARVGVDIDADGHMDQWTGWVDMQEAYFRMPGFVRQVGVAPARVDCSALPAGYGFQFEFKVARDEPEHPAPAIEKVEFEFSNID